MQTYKLASGLFPTGSTRLSTSVATGIRVELLSFVGQVSLHRVQVLIDAVSGPDGGHCQSAMKARLLRGHRRASCGLQPLGSSPLRRSHTRRVSSPSINHSLGTTSSHVTRKVKQKRQTSAAGTIH